MNLNYLIEKYRRLFKKLYGQDLFYTGKDTSLAAIFEWLAITNKEIAKLGIKKIRKNEAIMRRMGW